MSYDITTSEVLLCKDAWMRADDIREVEAWRSENNLDLSSAGVFGLLWTRLVDKTKGVNTRYDKRLEQALAELKKHDPDAVLKITESAEKDARIPLSLGDLVGAAMRGSIYEFFKDHVCPKIRGRIEMIFIWEGGDSLSGLIVDGGAVVECDVEYKLIPKSSKGSKG